MNKDEYVYMDSKSCYVQLVDEDIDRCDRCFIAWKHNGKIHTHEYVLGNWPSDLLVLNESLDSFWGALSLYGEFPKGYELSEEAWKDYMNFLVVNADWSVFPLETKYENQLKDYFLYHKKVDEYLKNLLINPESDSKFLHFISTERFPGVLYGSEEKVNKWLEGKNG